MRALSIKCFLATLALTLLSACGGDNTTNNSSQEAPKTESAQTLMYKVGIETPYPPYVQLGETGDYEGFDVDILTEIGKREGFGLVWQPHSWEGIHELLNTKELDIVASGGFDTEERRAKYAFTQPYNTETIVLITQDPNAKSFNDARGKRISYLTGSVEEQIVGDLTNGQGLTGNFGHNSSSESVRQVLQGKSDFAIDASGVYAHYAKQFPEQKLRAIHQDNPQINHVAFAVQQSNAELLAKLNKGLNAIKADGTYDKLKAKWFAPITTQ